MTFASPLRPDLIFSPQITVNPTPVTVNPTPVTVNPTPVLLGGRDFFYWPCVQGEDLPPALASTIYTRLAGQPVLGNAGSASWPAYAPTGPNAAATVMVMRFRFRFGNSTPNGLTFGFFNTSNAYRSGPRLMLNSNSQAAVEVLGASLPTFTNVNMPSRYDWHVLELRVPTVPGPDQPILMDGQPLVNDGTTLLTIPYVAGVCVDVATLAAQLAPNSHISQVSAAWEVPPP